ERTLSGAGRLGASAPSGGVREPRLRNLHRLVRSAYRARRATLARALRPGRDRITEAQHGQLRGGGPATATSFARWWGFVQAALVAILAASGSEPSSRDRPATGWHARIDRPY